MKVLVSHTISISLTKILTWSVGFFAYEIASYFNQKYLFWKVNELTNLILSPLRLQRQPCLMVTDGWNTLRLLVVSMGTTRKKCWLHVRVCLGYNICGIRALEHQHKTTFEYHVRLIILLRHSYRARYKKCITSTRLKSLSGLLKNTTIP